MKLAQVRHKHFHLAMQAAARPSDDLLALKYYKSMFRIFY